jgi:opacity protein-like surface antigen
VSVSFGVRRGALAAAIAATVVGLTASSSARAQETVGSDDLPPETGRHHHFESPQHFEIEIRFSPFKPNVDSDPALNGATPYGNLFGSTPRLMVSAEFDWQAFHIPHLGSIGPGVGVGYTSISAKAPFADTSLGISDENTSLAIYPFTAMAVLRIDEFWRGAGIPIVPYAKIGLGYALWRASNTLGTSSYQGVIGEGHSIGTHLALGVGFNLNVFDAYAAQNFDDAMGVNGTYLFAEVMREDYTGLGLQKDPLRVGGTNWNFGFAFAF